MMTKTTKTSRVIIPSDLEELLEDLGMSLYPSTGDEIRGWCPRHEKRVGYNQGTPHWYINRETGLFQCWSCGYRGHLLTLVQDFGKNIWEALRFVRQYGLDISNLEVNDYERKVIIKEIPQNSLDKFEKVPESICKKRKLHTAVVDDYGIRWDKKNLYWIIPIKSFSGELLGWQEKGKNWFSNQPQFVLKSLSLFGFHNLIKGDPVILLESPLDVVRLASIGIGNAVASYGASVSEEQIRAISSFSDEIILALDNDEAGWNEARRIRDRYLRQFRLYVISYNHTKVKDVGDMSDNEIFWAFDKMEPALIAQMRKNGTSVIRGTRRP